VPFILLAKKRTMISSPLLEEMHIRNLSPSTSTQRTYAEPGAGFARHLGQSAEVVHFLDCVKTSSIASPDESFALARVVWSDKIYIGLVARKSFRREKRRMHGVNYFCR
jgi:hypothetical protein